MTGSGYKRLPQIDAKSKHFYLDEENEGGCLLSLESLNSVMETQGDLGWGARPGGKEPLPDFGGPSLPGSPDLGQIRESLTRQLNSSPSA